MKKCSMLYKWEIYLAILLYVLYKYFFYTLSLPTLFSFLHMYCYKLALIITEIDACSELSVDCGAHSEFINSPEENQGYRCDQYSKSCSLKGMYTYKWGAHNKRFSR